METKKMYEEQELKPNMRHNWTKKELTKPEYRSKVVKLKTDYKREQNNLIKMKYEVQEKDVDLY